MKIWVTISLGLVLATAGVAQTQQVESNFSQAERLQIAVQKICPVSGGELGCR